MPSQRSLSVALTGGIASGKSAVSQYFERLGAPIFDADIAARELVAPDKPALKEIVATFGNAVLTPSGTLDRQSMRERIFSDPAARRRLEEILHPRIREELRTKAMECSSPYCVLAIPLLAEHREHYEWVDRVVVVDVARQTQLTRLMQRDEMTMQSARLALDAQATRSQRLALATDVIDNDGDLSSTAAAVARLDQYFRRIAAKKTAATKQ